MGVKLKNDQTSWQKCSRYSNRQQAKLSISGFKGLAHYQGDLEEFLPYLILGQFTHVGKGCVFGLGEYGLSWK